MVCFTKNPSRVIEVTNSKDNVLISVCNIEQLEAHARWKVFSAECSIQPIPHINQLIHLTGSMYYLYIVKPTTIRIRCNENSINKSVNKPILVKNLKKDCFIHYDDGWFTRLSEQKTKTIYQFSNHHSPYSVHEQDLIQKDPINSDNFKPIRNLQSDFGNLLEQIRNYNNKPKMVKNILKSDELLVILLVITMLITSTWILIAYCSYKSKLRLSNWLQNTSPGIDSMTTINENTQPNLNYRFHFNYPPIPIKLRSNSSRNIPKSPVDSYDIPKSTPLQLSTPTRSTPTNENIQLIPFVHYAQVHKKSHSSDFQSSEPRTSL